MPNGFLSGRELLAMVRPGAVVSAWFSNGLGEKKVRVGKVNPLLIFPGSHVVIDLGGKHGTPGVVSADNIVSVKIGDVVRNRWRDS